MRLEDIILVSVDDHVVEPPDVFEHHLPKKYADIAPRIVHNDDGTDVWKFLDFNIPNVGLNAVAGRPPDEYGMDPTSFDELRPGTYDVSQRVLDMSANGLLGSMNFPSLPGFAGRLFAAGPGQGRRARAAPARTTTGTSKSGARTHPSVSSRSRSRRSGTPRRSPTRCGASRRRAATRSRSRRTPCRSDYPSLHSDHWDPVWQACSDEGTVVCMHIGSSSKLVITAMDAPVDVMISLQPMNIVQAAADLLFSRVFREFPERHVRAVRGRHRVDPVLPRARRPHLQGPPVLDAFRLRRQAAERGVHGARDPVLHRRRLRRPPRA